MLQHKHKQETQAQTLRMNRGDSDLPPRVCAGKSDLFPLNAATMNMVRHASVVAEENGDVVALLTWKRKNTEFTLKLCRC